MVFEREGNYIVVYTDGCCINNHLSGTYLAKAGVGVFFSDYPPGSEYNVSAPLTRHAPTNQNAEIQAATMAIRKAQSAGISRLILKTDSQYLIDCIYKWMPGWRNNGYYNLKHERVANADALIELDNALNSWGGDYQFVKVPGHSKLHGNDRADAFANAGAERYSH